MKRKRNTRTASMKLESLEGRQMMSAGDLDATFGVGGKLISQAIGFVPADIAVQKDGKIVAVGKLNDDFAVARLNPNGTLDLPFGGNNAVNRGIALADFGGDRGDAALAVAIQADGKIVVAGHMDDTSNTTLADVGGFVVARYNADGSLDKSFDGDGKLHIDTAGADPSFASAVAIQPDGKIVLAGKAGTRGRFAPPIDKNDFTVARLNPNGSLDRTFGNALGIGTTRTGQLTIGFGGDDNEGATALALARDGKILVGGIGGSGSAKFAVARLNANGTIDKSFGDGISGEGRFNNLLLKDPKLRDLSVQPDGSVVLVGGTEGNFAVAKLTSAGRLDRSFGGNGHVRTDFGGNDEAKHVRVNREGILVAGGSGGKFAMARFRANGQLDSSFGQGGKVITTMANGDAILTTTLTSDGKLLAYGRSGSVARYVVAAPKVNVFSLDPNGAEGGNNPASLIFTRDLRLSFPTRVFYTLAGTASINSDYTGPSVLRPANTSGASGASGAAPVGGILGDSTAFVDIRANETFAVVPINVVNDNVMEQVETIRASLRPGAPYALGDRTTQDVEIAANDELRVNFQLKASPVAAAYEPDLGLAFGARGNGLRFGWDVDNRANARDRGFAAPGYIYNTFNHMQKPGGGSRWEVAVPNGMYQVKLAAGDPASVDSVYRINLENTPVLSGTPANTVRWFERTVNVLVSDGRLTLSNGAGAVNNKIAFIEIKPAAPGASAGAVTGNTPVRLPRILPGTPPTGGTIFSQIRI